MSMRQTVFLGSLGWVAAIGLLHGIINLGMLDRPSGRLGLDASPFRVGFIPVTCHLTCPVTHYINEQMTGDGIFDPVRFNGWPELKETFLAEHLQATFILAPLAMALREQGVPIKIVYLGHRDGTTMMVHKDSKIFRIEDLRGKKIAVPNRFSNQRLIIFKAFKERGMKHRARSRSWRCPRPTCRRRFTRAPSTRSSPASRSWPNPKWTATAASCS